MRRRALGVADDGRQHDGTVDLPPAALLRCCGCSLENAFQVLRDHDAAAALRSNAILRAAEEAGNVAQEARDIDIARLENDARLGILRQRQKQML
jgi:hypothetical protein